MTIGDRIREFRVQKGFSQRELGQKSDTAETTVRQYESNKRQPKIEQIEKIAFALEISPVNLMGWEYLDKKQPNGFVEYFAFISYLESMDYIVQVEGNEVLESHCEDMLDSNDTIVGQAEIVDQSTFTVTLIKEGKKTIFSGNEFNEFQFEIKKSIDYQIWQKK